MNNEETNTNQPEVTTTPNLDDVVTPITEEPSSSNVINQPNIEQVPQQVVEPVQMDTNLNVQAQVQVQEQPQVQMQEQQMNANINNQPQTQMQEQPQVQMQPDNSQPINNNKKKNVGIKILLFILVFLVAGLVAFGIFYVYRTSEKMIINNSIKQLESFKDYLILPSYFDENGDYTTNRTMNIKISENDDETLTRLSTLLNTLTFDYTNSKSGDKRLLEFNINKENQVLLGAKLYANESTGYIFLNELFDKYIQVDEIKEALSTINENNVDDYNYIYNFIVKSVVKNISKDKYVKGKDEISINNEKVNVNSLTLEYNEKEILELIDLVIADIKLDENANSIITNVYEEFKDYNMSETISELDTEHMSTYTYVVYTNKLASNIMGVDISSKYYERKIETCDDDYDDDEYDYDYKDAVEIEDGVIYGTSGDEDEESTDVAVCVETDEYVEKNYTLAYRSEETDKVYLYEKETMLGYLDIIKKDNTVTFNAYSSEDVQLAYMKINNTKTLYEIEINYIDGSDKYIINISQNIETVKENEEYNIVEVIKFEGYKINDKVLGITLNSSGTIKNSSTIEENVSEAVKYGDLTEENIQEIYTNLMQKVLGEVSAE